jgi:small GTP-binding protein
MQSIKIVAVGDGAVGKTSLLMVFAHNNFPADYVPTIFDNFACNVIVDEQPVGLSLWDTAGQEDYARMRPLSYPHTDVFLVCFAVGSRASFDNVRTVWAPELAHHAPHVPVVLVGTKLDQRDDSAVAADLARRGQRPVSFPEGVALAKAVGASQYIEVSALRQHRVPAVFEAAVRAARRPRPAPRPARKLCVVM